MRVFLEEHRIGTPHVPQITVENFLKSVKTHSLKSVCIRSYCGPHFLAFELNTERYVFSSNVGKCAKNADQNNSEYEHLTQ